MKRFLLSTALTLALGLVGTTGSVFVSLDEGLFDGSGSTAAAATATRGQGNTSSFGAASSTETQTDSGSGNDTANNPGNARRKGNSLIDCNGSSPGGGDTRAGDPANGLKGAQDC